MTTAEDTKNHPMDETRLEVKENDCDSEKTIAIITKNIWIMILGFASSVMIAMIYWNSGCSGNPLLKCLPVFIVASTFLISSIAMMRHLIYVDELDTVASTNSAVRCAKFSSLTFFAFSIGDLSLEYDAIWGTWLLGVLSFCIGHLVFMKFVLMIMKVKPFDLRHWRTIAFSVSSLIGISMSSYSMYTLGMKGGDRSIMEIIPTMTYFVIIGMMGPIMTLSWPDIDESILSTFGIHSLQFSDIITVINDMVIPLPYYSRVVMLSYWTGCAFLTMTSTLFVNRSIGNRIKRTKHSLL